MRSLHCLAFLSFTIQHAFLFTRFLVMRLLDSPLQVSNLIIGCIFVLATNAALVELNWNITYTNANPDGLYERRVVGVNGKWP